MVNVKEKEKETLRKFLLRVLDNECIDAMFAEGYDDLEFILSLDQEGIDAMATHLHIKRGHKLQLVRQIHKVNMLMLITSCAIINRPTNIILIRNIKTTAAYYINVITHTTAI
jgi:hypothetical protein